MKKKQFQNKLLRSFYRPKRSKLINSETFSAFDEMDLLLDKKIGRITGNRTRKPPKKDEKDEKED